MSSASQRRELIGRGRTRLLAVAALEVASEKETQSEDRRRLRQAAVVLLSCAAETREAESRSQCAPQVAKAQSAAASLRIGLSAAEVAFVREAHKIATEYEAFLTGRLRKLTLPISKRPVRKRGRAHHYLRPLPPYVDEIS